jgi:hypothetical protein
MFVRSPVQTSPQRRLFWRYCRDFSQFFPPKCWTSITISWPQFLYLFKIIYRPHHCLDYIARNIAKWLTKKYETGVFKEYESGHFPMCNIYLIRSFWNWLCCRHQIKGILWSVSCWIHFIKGVHFFRKRSIALKHWAGSQALCIKVTINATHNCLN